MSSKSNKRRQEALRQIAGLKKTQRNQILKMVVITVLTAVVVIGIEYFVLMGTLAWDDTVNGIVTMVIVFIMAAIDGNLTRDYIKARDEARMLMHKCGISEEEAKAALKG